MVSLLKALVKPRPFVEWAGGKRQILKHFFFYAMKEFLVGELSFFELSPKKAVISGLNAGL